MISQHLILFGAYITTKQLEAFKCNKYQNPSSKSQRKNSSDGKCIPYNSGKFGVNYSVLNHFRIFDDRSDGQFLLLHYFLVKGTYRFSWFTLAVATDAFWLPSGICTAPDVDVSLDCAVGFFLSPNIFLSILYQLTSFKTQIVCSSLSYFLFFVKAPF